MMRPPCSQGRRRSRRALFVQTEFALAWEFCRIFFGRFLGSYCWCQCAPSLLVQAVPESVVNRKTATSLACPKVWLLGFGGASLLDSGVNSMRTALPVHCGRICFHFLPPLRLNKRLPVLSRARNRLPCDTEWPSPFPPKT